MECPSAVCNGKIAELGVVDIEAQGQFHGELRRFTGGGYGSYITAVMVYTYLVHHSLLT